eukprot:2071423-Rhodomonas_salina.1
MAEGTRETWIEGDVTDAGGCNGAEEREPRENKVEDHTPADHRRPLQNASDAAQSQRASEELGEGG